MSASWASDRGRRARAAALAQPHHAVLTAIARALLGGLLMLGLAANVAGAARIARIERTDDSGRVVRRISVSDRGVEIVARDRDVDKIVDVRKDEGVVKVEIEDTLGFHDAAPEESPPGVVIDVNESGVVRMFSDAEVRPGERVDGDVVAVFGDVFVDGEVSGNAVAVFGSLRLSPEAKIAGDAVAIGGVLDQPAGAHVGGESVSLGFLPLRFGAPTIGMILGFLFMGWLVSLFMGWLLFLLFPMRMLRTAVTASQRTGGSLALGLLSGPMLIIGIVLLAVTVIGIPIAIVLPLVYLLMLWAGQLALSYAVGCRLLRRRPGEGSFLAPLAAGTMFVGGFFVLGVMFGQPDGIVRTGALFFHLLGVLMVMGLSIIGLGAFILSRLGTRPREVVYREGAAPAAGAASGGTLDTGTPVAPPAPGV